MTRFVDATDATCRTPLVMAHNVPGPDMLICGQQTLRGRTCCEACHSRLYYKPTKQGLANLDKFTFAQVQQQTKRGGDPTIWMKGQENDGSI